MESERLEQMLKEAAETKRPILVNPTEEQVREKAEELRLAGKLICTACRKPITGEAFHTQRIRLSRGIEAVAHIHPECVAAFNRAMADEPEPQ